MLRRFRMGWGFQCVKRGVTEGWLCLIAHMRQKSSYAGSCRNNGKSVECVHGLSNPGLDEAWSFFK
jgi:hypothetical protein